MTRRERIRKTLRGEATDRPPVSFWRHFYDREGSAKDLADSMLAFQKTYDWDLLKVNLARLVPRRRLGGTDGASRDGTARQAQDGPGPIEARRIGARSAPLDPTKARSASTWTPKSALQPWRKGKGSDHDHLQPGFDRSRPS